MMQLTRRFFERQPRLLWKPTRIDSFVARNALALDVRGCHEIHVLPQVVSLQNLDAKQKDETKRNMKLLNLYPPGN